MRLAPMGIAGRADEADHLAAGEMSTLRKAAAVCVQVCVVVDEVLASVCRIYRESTLAAPMQSEHAPVVGGQDRCSARCGDVDRAVYPRAAPRGSKGVGYLIRRHARDGHH